MTRAEISAYNQGVYTVVALARASADAMRAKLVEKPTRYAFAIEALQAVADEADSFAFPLPHQTTLTTGDKIEEQPNV